MTISMDNTHKITLSSFIAEFSTFPIDTIRAKVQGNETFISTRNSHIFHQLYSGIGLAVFRQISVTTLKLSFLNKFKTYGLQNEFVSGWLSGTLATIIKNPIDILKNHRQTPTCYTRKKNNIINKEILNQHVIA